MWRPRLRITAAVCVTALLTFYSTWLYYNRKPSESTQISQLTAKEGFSQKSPREPEVPLDTASAATTATTVTTTTTTTTATTAPKTAATKSPEKKNSWTPFYLRTTLDGKRDLPRILFWTTIYGYWFSDLTDEGVAELEYKGCPDRCYIANDRRTLNVSDAVVFYGHDLVPKKMPKKRAPFQKWVYWSLEPPWHCPVASLKGLTNTINWTMTYRLDSDILDSYATITELTPARQPYSKRSLKSIWKGKIRMAAWAVSSCNTSGKREDYVRELRKHIDVDVYGECGDNKCPRKIETACYETFAKNYFFYLSFENCICKDYVTEKLFKPLKHDIIPVVYGGANYRDAAPPGSYIDAMSFESPMHLARHLKNVASDYDLYKTYFEWKGKYKIKPFAYYNFCALCRKLHSEDFKKTSVVPDIYHWWNTSSKCRAWNKNTHKFEF